MTDQVNEALRALKGQADAVMVAHATGSEDVFMLHVNKLLDAVRAIEVTAHPSRGVVDEAMVERAMDADAEEYGASIPASRVRRILEAAALQAAQPAVPSVPDVFILDRGFKYENGEHTPTVLVGFAPGDFDARDRFAASLAATPKDQPAQGEG